MRSICSFCAFQSARLVEYGDKSAFRQDILDSLAKEAFHVVELTGSIQREPQVTPWVLLQSRPGLLKLVRALVVANDQV